MIYLNELSLFVDVFFTGLENSISSLLEKTINNTYLPHGAVAVLFHYPVTIKNQTSPSIKTVASKYNMSKSADMERVRKMIVDAIGSREQR